MPGHSFLLYFSYGLLDAMFQSHLLDGSLAPSQMIPKSSAGEHPKTKETNCKNKVCRKHTLQKCNSV